jgi:hypothetical protein
MKMILRLTTLSKIKQLKETTKAIMTMPKTV